MSCSAAGAVSMASFGETLKRERELREISLRQISEATKINIRYLEALEENRFDALPGGLFNKGFIRAYATYIGVDGEAMVNSYLSELSARQQGIETAGGRAPSNLHRPAEVPQRRAAPHAGSGGAERAAARGLALAPAQGAAEPHASTASHVPAASHAHGALHGAGAPHAPGAPHAAAASHVPAPQPTPFPVRAPDGPEGRPAPAAAGRETPHGARPAVTGIEVADHAAPASSRVLVWVLSLVAAAGVLFLILSLVRGRMPGHRPPTDLVHPAARQETAPATPPDGGDAPAPGGEGETAGGAGEAAGGDSSHVLPEITSQSPVTLGALAAPAPKTTPAATPATPPRTPQPARTPPEKRAAVAPVAPPDAAGEPWDDSRDEPQGERERARERAAGGPMKVEIDASARTYVVLICDGGEVVNRMMEAGERAKARCDSVIRVSAADAGAVRLAVNGYDCLPLGEPGTRAYGYTIRIDDHDRICPAPQEGSDERF